MIKNEGIYEVLDSKKSDDGTLFEVLKIKKLSGPTSIEVAKNLYYMNKANMTLKLIRITLNNSFVRLEPGALYYMKGDLHIKSSFGGNFFKGLKRKALSGETAFISEIHGTGEIYTEPSFSHYILYEISPEEQGVIVDKGIFYAGSRNLDVDIALQKNLATGLFSGEGLVQTKIKGQGIAVLNSPVPFNELIRVELNGEKLYVDGSFAILRSLNIDFKVEKSAKGLISSMTSGEGLLQTFSGNGFVLLAPTEKVYKALLWTSVITPTT